MVVICVKMSVIGTRENVFNSIEEDIVPKYYSDIS